MMKVTWNALLIVLCTVVWTMMMGCNTTKKDSGDPPIMDSLKEKVVNPPSGAKEPADQPSGTTKDGFQPLSKNELDEIRSAMQRLVQTPRLKDFLEKNAIQQDFLASDHIRDMVIYVLAKELEMSEERLKKQFSIPFEVFEKHSEYFLRLAQKIFRPIDEALESQKFFKTYVELITQVSFDPPNFNFAFTEQEIAQFIERLEAFLKTGDGKLFLKSIPFSEINVVQFGFGLSSLVANLSEGLPTQEKIISYFRSLERLKGSATKTMHESVMKTFNTYLKSNGLSAYPNFEIIDNTPPRGIQPNATR